MLHLELILRLMDRMVELAILIAKDVPPEARFNFWQRHDDRMQWLHGLVRRGSDGTTADS
jgi:hypothetical protein